jgi:hypothetical protein
VAGNVADEYPLAPLQEGLFFQSLVSGDGPDVYVLPTVLEFESRERLAEFTGALELVMGRHDIFRSSLAWEGLPGPVQVVWRRAVLPVTEVVLPAGADPVAGLLAAAPGRMDLSRAPLVDVHAAAEPGTGRWLALLRVHHLVQDHATLEVVLGEVGLILAGRARELPAPARFADFVARARLGPGPGEHERFFAGLVGDVTEPTAPYGLLDVHLDGSGTGQARLAVSDRATAAVREQARRAGVSPATLWHVAWARVLASLAGREDVVFGTVLLGRMGAADTGRVPGPFINTLPVRVRSQDGAAADAVAAMGEQLGRLLVHEHAPLSVAVAASAVPQGQPLFTSLLNFRHSPAGGNGGVGAGDGAGAGGGLGGIRVLSARERTNYPVAVSVDDTGTGFTVTAQAVSPADPAQVAAMLATAADALAAALEGAPRTPLRDIAVMTAVDQQHLIDNWNSGSWA